MVNDYWSSMIIWDKKLIWNSKTFEIFIGKRMINDYGIVTVFGM